MHAMDVVNDAKTAMRVTEVYGTPYEKNGLTIIPAASISGGAGGGGGGSQEAGAGEGAGFGVSSRPVGAFVIKGDEVSWQPAIDATRVILMGQLMAIVGLLTLRVIVKALARRN